MNIVHVIPALTKGGAERVTVDLANAAVARGNAVAIIAACAVSEDLLLKDLRREVEVRFVAGSSGSNRAAYIRLLPWMLRNRQWLLSRDIIHCHLTFGSVFGTVARFLRGLGSARLPLIVETYHAVGMPIPQHRHAFHAALMRRRDGVVLMAEDSFWTRFRQSRARRLTAVIPNGVRKDIARPSAAETAAYRESAGIPDGATVVGTVGRLDPARRPDLLVEVFVNVARETEETVHFLIAGEGSERAALEQDIDRRGIRDRVHLPGLVLDPAIAFSAIDLYLTLNVGPVTGIAALEAGTFGLPIVALQLRDDYYPEETDWIWSSRDPKQLSEHIVALIRDPSEAAEIAERQRRHVLTHCSVDAMVEAYHDFYTAALARSGSQRTNEQKR